MSSLSDLLECLIPKDADFYVLDLLGKVIDEVKAPNDDLEKLYEQWRQEVIDSGYCPECGEKLGFRYVNAGSDQIPIGDHTETIYYTDAYKRCKSCGWDEEYDR